MERQTEVRSDVTRHSSHRGAEEVTSVPPSGVGPYLSLSLGGLEELWGGGPEASGVATVKPAPKLVI